MTKDDRNQARVYAAIDLKSFYASCACVDLKLDPLTTNLVVADASRTNKTICLAVSPALKSFGIPGRPRLFEVEQAVAGINAARRLRAPGGTFSGTFTDIRRKEDPTLSLDYLIAKPQMARYMEISTKIYGIYLSHVSEEDIFAYSIDEVFIDLTPYLKIYDISARDLVIRMIRDVLKQTGITATAGIGTNLFLAKVAMDVVAKHVEADADGVRIASLDPSSFRRLLWNHRPITDIWRIGRGTAKTLADHGMFTLGDVARVSVSEDPFGGEALLFRLFGVNAELLIDHAWGMEPATIADIKAYVPENTSTGTSQVLSRPYGHDEARIIVQEMTDTLSLDLVDKGLVCDSVTLYINYDVENISDPSRKGMYRGPVVQDYYGRAVPKPVHGSMSFPAHTSSTQKLMEAMLAIYERITDPSLSIRRVTVTANNTLREAHAASLRRGCYEQLSLFTDQEAVDREREKEHVREKKEKSLQHAVLDIKKKYGKNAILKGTNFTEAATGRDRNAQVGGHKA